MYQITHTPLINTSQKEDIYFSINKIRGSNETLHSCKNVKDI